MGARWQTGDVVDGRYQVERAFENGGMGLVYRVRHLAWGVDLAVKCPRPELFRDEIDRQRFVDEAQVWVSLGLHPNVCACHYVRTLDGIPRVFAEFVPGGSLTDWIRDGRLYEGDRIAVLARILDFAIQTARGLEHAHSRGLVHQDVKPANVLLDEDGTAKVTDFGLARARAVAATQPADTAPGTSILVPTGGLTRAYASPEQTAGQPLSRRADIYSFAVSVLEMFTGGVIWMVGPVAGEALAAHLADGPEAGLPRMPTELAELLADCLRAESADRPRSMAEVAAALAEVYRQVVGVAYPRPEPVAADLRADELNNRALSLLDLGQPDEAAEAFTAARIADPRHLKATYNAGLLRWRRGEITDENLVTDLEAVRADTGDPWLARHLLAQVQLERGDLDAARELLDGIEQAAPGEPDVEATLRVLRSGRAGHAFCAETVAVPWNQLSSDPLPPKLALCLTPDGRVALTGDDRGRVRVWDVRSGRCVCTLRGHRKRVTSVDITADGRFGITSGEDLSVRVWDLVRGRRLRVFRPPGLGGWSWIRSVHVRDDGRLALAAANDGPVWDVHTGQSRFHLDSHVPDDQARGLALSGSMLEVSADGRTALSAGHQDRTVRLWDLETGRYRVVTTNEKSVSGLAFGADGRTAVVGSYFAHLDVLDLADGRRLHTVAGHYSLVERLALSADGRFLLSGGADDGVRLWELGRDRCLRTFRGHLGRVSEVRFAPWGALSAGEDNTARRWTLPGGFEAAPALSKPRQHPEIARLDVEVRAIVGEAEQEITEGRFPRALELLNQARAIEGYERDPRVMAAWRTLGGHCARVGLRASWPCQRLTGHTKLVFSAGLSADGRVAVTGSQDLSVRIWDARSGSCLHSIEDRPSPVDSVDVGADGRLVLSACRDGEVGVWSAETGGNLVLLRGEQTLGARVARLSADGTTVVTAGMDHAVRVWDVESGQCVRTMTGHRGKVGDLAFGADGRLVASGGDSVRLWDLDSGECVQSLPAVARTVCLSHDGRFAVSADDSAQLWDIATGQCVRTFETGPVRTARFTGGGRFLACGGSGGISVWDVHSGQLVRAPAEPSVSGLAATPDHLLAAIGDTARLIALDWELES
ncbi:WD40 repeat domain-containing serine/threonine protein kinase [Amycolatopsis magusensis]|uniref:WD40 repeat domain-containing serine/threonine protein kinase n=1 Tax=Amycolatopsis magusensis TaxID=882444 RepID=UPI0024A7D8F4|nr:protein kinase [Amycolatopsis magusensis]MDI5974570.1 protein kinase [Amycolatopsis magusensis]